MRKYLTIGEVAKLLNISTYNIRYYEKEELFKPSHFSDKGYRLYSYEDIYVLNGIMILRESGLSIKEIKKLFSDYTVTSYKLAMERSFENIEKQIEKLTALKEIIEESLNIVAKYEQDESIYSIKHLPKRVVSIIHQSDYKMDYSIKDIYDIYQEHSIDMSSMYRSDMYYILEDNQISFCLLDENNYLNLESLIFEEGKYLSYCFFVNDDDEIAVKAADIFQYIIKSNMEFEGDLLLIVDVKTSMIRGSGYIGELQIKIK